MKKKSNYKIINLIGRGQFGKVFAAIERRSGRLLALKELNLKHLSTSDFLRELHFSTSLKHDRIVGCQAMEHYRDRRYLVMDYYEGGTLRDLLDSSWELTIHQSLKLVIDILQGLQYAHSKGIIHRDIKPENILLKLEGNTWTAHISDFGIAKLYQSDRKINMGDTGSPAYMSPEQFYGQYSYSCDLYAAGIILYELILGERPFSGIPKQLIAAHINQTATIPENVPFMVRIAIAKSLQKLPQKRFSDASAMARALQLAKDILPTDYSLPLPESNRESLLQSLCLLSTAPLSKSVDKLATADELVYLGQADCLKINRYPDGSLSQGIEQWSIPLDNAIEEIEIRASGCFVTTQSSLYYLPLDTTSEQFHFFSQTFLPIITFPTNNLVSSIEPGGNWFTVSYIPHKSKTPIWEIYQLPNCDRQQSQINRQPWHRLIALSNRYGLGIYINPKQHTEFHLFNNYGKWIINFTVRTKLERISYNPQFPDRLLATEANNPNTVIIITLQPFNLQRISIEITPILITPYPQGYLISDRSNRLIAIDGKDSSIRQFSVPLSAENSFLAIAPCNNKLLIATATSSEYRLHQLSLPTTNDQQPMTNNQQPITNNQQPTTNNQ